jgi:F0F1-type ATP synthase membrane subunit b/b'
MAILDEGMKEAKRIISKSKQEIKETIAHTKADLEKEIPLIVDEILKKLVTTRG